MTGALALGTPLDPGQIRAIERTLNLDHFKWDTQVGDHPTLSRHPLIIRQSKWKTLCTLAERLAAETEDLEACIVNHPELHRGLGIPGALRRVLKDHRPRIDSSRALRTMRFDFHPTHRGWVVSEVNSDVPGGFGEASILPQLFRPHCDNLLLPPFPLSKWGDAIQSALSGGTVAFLSAPGFLEDQQVVRVLMRELAARGFQCRWIQSPSELQWLAGEPYLTDRPGVRVAGIVRFYQAEWLCKLPGRSGWRNLMSYSGMMANPAVSIFSESKRLPLMWSRLTASSATWRSLLPECCDPGELGMGDREEWVLKAAYSNTGDSVKIGSSMSVKEWKIALRAARWQRHRWVAQRSFQTLSFDSVHGPVHPCIGVFVIDRKAAGAYVRLSRRQVTDCTALDAPLFIEPE
jgi:glutathionylspermidine synthase